MDSLLAVSNEFLLRGAFITKSLLVRIDEGLVEPTSSFPEYCFSVESTFLDTRPPGERLYFGLAASGKLYASDDSLSATLSTSVNSFILTPSYLVFVTNSHDAFFVPLLSLPMLISSEKGSAAALQLAGAWEKRRVERGSRIVVAVPSAMSLVLQMPRGNLETINPRPLVLEIVKQDVDMYVPVLFLPLFFFFCLKGIWPIGETIGKHF